MGVGFQEVMGSNPFAGVKEDDYLAGGSPVEHQVSGKRLGL